MKIPLTRAYWRNTPGRGGRRRARWSRPGSTAPPRGPAPPGRSLRLAGLVRCEPVPGPRLGQDQRHTALVLQLRAEPAHVDPHVLGLGLVAVPPDPAQQVRVGEQLAPVGDELA